MECLEGNFDAIVNTKYQILKLQGECTPNIKQSPI